MKNDQKNLIYPSIPFSCMLEQLMTTVQGKSNEWHLNIHIWGLNLNLVFKPTPFKLMLVALAQINNILPCHYHASYCPIALIVFYLRCRCLSPLSRHGFDDGIDDIDEELYYLQKCQASKTPLFIPIQSHSLASALFYYIRTTTLQLLPAAVVEPLSSA